ncbi:LysE/ArgO family amino acid transporter [Litorilituus sediminis]|uniref:Amino acid transporter n=1 Tax=Litorilituus sediminis TaxID=718192 RepID=A0A4P6P3H3_9GAMM|nr:LysE/ArgO family amino acid transporter [Litorilituus sediminis]QBG36066.1 amino acid transporter [Litorilituus sediminis]
MSLLVMTKGFTLALSMIIPIGSQNSLLLNQGINRNHHVMTATLFVLYDVILMTLGIFGGSLILSSSDLLFTLLTWGGIAFLFSYGLMSFKAAYQGNTPNAVLSKEHKSAKIVILTSLIVTFLNPHAYIDTVMVIGSVGGQYSGDAKLYFLLGTILASMVWFSCLAFGAAKFSTQLSQPKVKRVIDSVIGIIMWAIAWSLFITWLNK